MKCVLFFFIVIALSSVFLYHRVQPSFRPDPQPVLIKIAKGSSAQQVARLLVDKKIIHSPSFFLMLSKISGKSKSFKSGFFLFERGRYWEIIRKLELGLTYRIKVTIPEGWSAYQIAERLKEEGIIDDAEIFVGQVKQKRLEGKLFPETYFFDPESDAANVINSMAAQFKKHFSDELARRAKEIKMTQLQVITLASIVEREAHLDAERPLIASVYRNRLKKGMLLEADPTVQYALGQGRVWKERLFYKDLNVSSPYNTYRRSGLPPGPICNPGMRSIMAALYPAETKYLYFVADGKGGHHFSVTLQEHLHKQRDQRRNHH